MAKKTKDEFKIGRREVLAVFLPFFAVGLSLMLATSWSWRVWPDDPVYELSKVYYKVSEKMMPNYGGLVFDFLQFLETMGLGQPYFLFLGGAHSDILRLIGVRFAAINALWYSVPSLFIVSVLYSRARSGRFDPKLIRRRSQLAMRYSIKVSIILLLSTYGLRFVDQATEMIRFRRCISKLGTVQMGMDQSEIFRVLDRFPPKNIGFISFDSRLGGATDLMERRNAGERLGGTVYLLCTTYYAEPSLLQWMELEMSSGKVVDIVVEDD